MRIAESYSSPLAYQWYCSLSVTQRLAVKETFVDVCGMTWDGAGALFSMRERIAIYHAKLVSEGIIRP